MTDRIKPKTDEPVSDAALWGLWLECQETLISGVSRFRETAEPHWRKWTKLRLRNIEAEIAQRKTAREANDGGSASCGRCSGSDSRCY